MKDIATRLRENADLDAAEGGNPDVCRLELDAANHIAAFTARVAELEADAMRYRWLRRAGAITDFSTASMSWQQTERLDEFIDAFISKGSANV